jgi:hypothetical protein
VQLGLVGSLPPLRAQQRAIWQEPDDAGRTDATGVKSPPADGGIAGLFAATDGLVDVINTVAHVLGGQAAPEPS